MEKIKIEITCPKCEKEFKERIENMRPGKSKKYPHCLTNIDFSGDDFSEAQKGAESKARNMIHKSGGGELITKGVNGKIRSKDTIKPAKDFFPPKDTEN
jgi:hypothetical protein